MSKAADKPSQPKKISAYYSLVFPNFTFYIQTLSITIGRRCSPNPNAADVDVDLGALKSVSRLHARIEYDEEEDRFVLVVIGRNGAWVDGVWSGSGTRAPLGERSQIQIASRTFHFVLPPPPPPPDDTPSPSSPSSSPSHSPPPREVKLPPPPPEPQLPNSNAITRYLPNLPLPTSQLIYRAIKALDGKATLQEICTWIMNEFDYYRYTDGNAWMSSVRHNLSSSRAFKKMERCGGDRGKGFFWSLDEEHQHIIEEQEAKAQQAAAAGMQSGTGKGDKETKAARKKEKGAPVSEPPLKRSIKGDTKGSALPPPVDFYSTAITGKDCSTSCPRHYRMEHQGYSGTPMSGPNPYAALTQSNWRMHSQVATIPVVTAAPTTTPNTTTSTPSASVNPAPATPTSKPVPAVFNSLLQQPRSPRNRLHRYPLSPLRSLPAIPDIPVPIVIGPIPPSHQDYSPSHPNNSAKEGYMVYHEGKLLLDPKVFSSITGDILTSLERMGAAKAMEILAGHMIRVMRERRARERKAARGRGRGGKVAGKSKKDDANGNPTAPFTTAPLPARGTSAVVQDTKQLPPPPVSGASTEPGSPIVVVDGSDDEGPAPKKRRVEESAPSLSVPSPDVTMVPPT
ncbi:fork head domain-containing protein [Desarmillaria tabescens]|uniref:Fork head domain-containing protein n=1 Tax=Armillaria tabescens TaxID=1929756 RepID=A0AA39NA72_ARMTA|nr:fork head domain-containing protein [Desarmillaria tabescens]KAK0461896.1 fork head domain-containing protein [Desarmillaria tabescens]